MAYTEEFYRLALRGDLAMMEQQAAKYINGLKYPIQEYVILHNVLSVDETHNKASKIEILQGRAPPFRRPAPIEESASDVVVQLNSTIVDRLPTRQSTNTSTSALTMVQSRGLERYAQNATQRDQKILTKSRQIIKKYKH